MAPKFYSGGFIYNPLTQKVLLHLRDNKTRYNPNTWAFFGGLSKGNESPSETFQREIYEELNVKLNPPQIIQLCDYFNPDFNVHRYVFYASLTNIKSKLKVKEGKDSGWFTLEEALHLNLTKRTMQDLLLFQKGPLK